jgi:hypothetical protein
MQWLRAETGALAFIMFTGCPSEFGKEGRIAQAVHNDSMEIVRKHCSQKEYDAVCGGNRENTQACHDTCG